MTTNTTTETMECKACGVTKPRTGEFWEMGSAGTFRRKCKACRREQNRAARRANPERNREAARRWREQNPDYMPGYTKANREHITSKELERRRADPEYNARHLAAARAYRARNRDRINANRSQSRLIGGLITPAEYAALLAKQKGACAICKDLPEARPAPGHTRRRALCVDHCHQTNRVRGLLCHPCNVAPGLFKDNPQHLKTAAKYLTTRTF